MAHSLISHSLRSVASPPVKLTLGTSRAGGFSAIVMHMEDEHGETIGGARPRPKSVELDGVAGGLQPTGDQPLPGQETN